MLAMSDAASVDQFENALDRRVARMKQDISLVYSELREGVGPSQRLSRRNFVLLLYAYWESLVKETMRDYVNLAQQSVSSYSELIPSFRLAHYRNHLLSRFKKHANCLSSSKLSVYDGIYKDFIIPEAPLLLVGNSREDAIFSSDSNLKPDVLARMLEWAGLRYPELYLECGSPESLRELYLADKCSHCDSRKTVYYYSWKGVECCLNSFVGHRNSVAHSALADPPDYHMCLFYYSFVRGLLDWFASEVRDAVENRRWLE